MLDVHQWEEHPFGLLTYLAGPVEHVRWWSEGFPCRWAQEMNLQSLAPHLEDVGGVSPLLPLLSYQSSSVSCGAASSRLYFPPSIELLFWNKSITIGKSLTILFSPLLYSFVGFQLIGIHSFIHLLNKNFFLFQQKFLKSLICSRHCLRDQYSLCHTFLYQVYANFVFCSAFYMIFSPKVL